MTPLTELLPQAAPMILLSGYTEPTTSDAVEAYVDIDEHAPFYETKLRGVPSCVALEYMAQAMALRVGLLRREAGLPPKVGFVLGSRRLSVERPVFKVGERYRVTVVCSFQDEEFGAFDCTIRDSRGATVASGTLTAYQPEEGKDLSELVAGGGNGV